ncbi:MAG: DUF1850 domain-containing protein [Pseudomonadota bacterium]
MEPAAARREFTGEDLLVEIAFPRTPIPKNFQVLAAERHPATMRRQYLKAFMQAIAPRQMSRARTLTAAGLALAALMMLFPIPAVTVRMAAGTQGLVWAVPAPAGFEFRLVWTHTVSRREVAEQYTVDSNGNIRLCSMVFDHEGPNLPAGPEAGTSWRFEGKSVTVTGYNQCFDRLNLGVSPYGHHLETGSWKWDMHAGVGPDRLIRVAVERTPLALILFSQVRQWPNINHQP